MIIIIIISIDKLTTSIELENENIAKKITYRDQQLIFQPGQIEL